MVHEESLFLIMKPILVLVQKPNASGIAKEETLVQELCLEEVIA